MGESRSHSPPSSIIPQFLESMNLTQTSIATVPMRIVVMFCLMGLGNNLNRSRNRNTLEDHRNVAIYHCAKGEGLPNSAPLSLGEKDRGESLVGLRDE